MSKNKGSYTKLSLVTLKGDITDRGDSITYTLKLRRTDGSIYQSVRKFPRQHSEQEVTAWIEEERALPDSLPGFLESEPE